LADSHGKPAANWPRLLFVPVSGAYGMGEYARSLAIARAVAEHWPQAEIRFLLSEQAPYVGEVPFEVTRLPASATFHTAEVIETMREFQPHVVLFDNAGRTAQLRATKHLGARVIFISARERQRRRAFRLHWMRLIDEHWIAYPKFAAGDLSRLERLKLKLVGSPKVRFLDVIGTAADAAALPPGLTGRLEGRRWVLWVPGGGTGHPGVADAPQRFLEAARHVTGCLSVVVGTEAQDNHPNLLGLPRIPQPQLLALMGKTQLVVANGGATLLQAIARGVASIAVPIAKDQPKRIAHCVAAGVTRAARLDPLEMAQAVETLLADEGARRSMEQRARALDLADGASVAVRALQELLEAQGGLHA
jgi:spore coat polysaccharide biosynthesis predicted glycosyltransferase SpsG